MAPAETSVWQVLSFPRNEIPHARRSPLSILLHQPFPIHHMFFPGRRGRFRSQKSGFTAYAVCLSSYLSWPFSRPSSRPYFITTFLPCFSLYIAIPSNNDNLLKISHLSHAKPYRLRVQNLCGGTLLPSLQQLELKPTSSVDLQTSRLGNYLTLQSA